MLINSKSRYAIIAMIDMMEDFNLKKITTLSQIATRQEISLNYLEQIFMKLKKAGIVNSIRGSKGGYTFAKKPSEIYLIEALIALGEVIEIKKCNCNNTCKVCCANNKKCNCHTLWTNFERYLYNYFSSISIEDVSKNKLFKF